MGLTSDHIIMLLRRRLIHTFRQCCKETLLTQAVSECGIRWIESRECTATSKTLEGRDREAPHLSAPQKPHIGGSRSPFEMQSWLPAG